MLSSVIAKNSKKFREDIGISQRAIARKSGLSKQTIVEIEAGRSNPTIDTIEALAEALEVSVRVLLTETGNDVLFESGKQVRWQEQGLIQVRNLGQVYGSGYVQNTVIKLDEQRGISRSRKGTRGMLRHCYVLEGKVQIGPEGRTVNADEGDFVRFSGEGPHLFHALTSSALVFVVTTTPQLTSRGGDQVIF